MDGLRGGVGGQSLLLTRSGGASSGLGKISPLFCSQLFSGGGGDDDIYTSLGVGARRGDDGGRERRKENILISTSRRAEEMIQMNNKSFANLFSSVRLEGYGIRLCPVKMIAIRTTYSSSMGMGPDIRGDPSARRLGYVDISSVSYRGYPETELMPT